MRGAQIMDGRKLARLLLHSAVRFGGVVEADSMERVLDEPSVLDLKS